MKAVGMSALLAALAITRGAIPACAETLEQRVDRMERELIELKAEIRRRDAPDRAPAAPRPPPPPPAPGAPTGPAGKPAPVVTAQTRPERAETPMPTTQVPYVDRLRMGGYGSVLLFGVRNPAADEHLV